MKKRLWSILIALALCLQLFPAATAAENSSTFSVSSGDVAINDVNFPDPVLREYIAENGDSNSNGVLDCENELMAFTSIRMRGIFGEISNVIGLELLPNLQHLSLEEMNMTRLDLSGLNFLTDIYLNSNGINKLKLPKSDNLKSLQISREKIQDLDLEVCPNLENLSIQYTESLEGDLNQAIILGSCTKLKKIELIGCFLTAAHFSNMPNLETLSLQENSVGNLCLYNLPNLKNLDISQTAISSLDISDLPALSLTSDCLVSRPLTLTVPQEGLSISGWRFMTGYSGGRVLVSISCSNLQGGYEDGNYLRFNDGSDVISFEQMALKDGEIITRQVILHKAKDPVVTKASVTLRISGGTWNDGTESRSVDVPLYNGIGFLKADMLPESIQPNTDYTSDGYWALPDNSKTPIDIQNFPVTGDTDFVYRVISKRIFRLSEYEVLGGRTVTLTSSKDIFRVSVDDPNVKKINGYGTDDFNVHIYRMPNVTKTYVFTGLYQDFYGQQEAIVQVVKVTADNGSLSFPDVADTHWFYDSVVWAVDEGIAAGFPDGSFRPNVNCSRAQIVTFLWRAAGCPKAGATKNPFPDVEEESWYHDAVLWAADQGIAAGFPDGTFCPNATCTRAQAVTFLHRARGASEPKLAENPFPDVEPNWSYKPILWAAENGIAMGFPDKTFRPNALCSRAHIVTFIQRAYS